MIVSFDSALNFPGWQGGQGFLQYLVETYGCKRILEIGSGANPTIEPRLVHDLNLSYVTSDVSWEEMEKADPTYERLMIDMSADEIRSDLAGQFDLVFSRMVAEHVSDGFKYHRNIHSLLKPCGISAHCFSTLWCVPFVVNRMLPEFVSTGLLKSFAPRNEHRQAKFPARYSWSRGPSPKMIARFEALGFEVLKYTGYFGHSYYVKVSRFIHQLETCKEKLLLRWPCPTFCSYATIVLRKT